MTQKNSTTAAKTRRGRPSKALLAQIKPLGKQHYPELLRAAVTAMLEQQTCVIIRVHHLMKFPASFPKGKIVERDGPFNHRKIRANQLLKWLNDIGHTSITSEDIRAQQIRLTVQLKELLGND